MKKEQFFNLVRSFLCEWTPERNFDELYYETECGVAVKLPNDIILDNDIETSGYIYCPFCGKEIYEVK